MGFRVEVKDIKVFDDDDHDNRDNDDDKEDEDNKDNHIGVNKDDNDEKGISALGLDRDLGFFEGTLWISKASALMIRITISITKFGDYDVHHPYVHC